MLKLPAYWLGVLGALLCYAPPISAYYNLDAALGMNTNEVMESDSSVPFIDLFRADVIQLQDVR